MDRTDILIRDVGGARFTLRAFTPKPKVDHGYDLPDRLYEVVIREHDFDWEEAVYADYESAYARFEREITNHAVKIARKALRIRA